MLNYQRVTTNRLLTKIIRTCGSINSINMRVRQQEHVSPTMEPQYTLPTMELGYHPWTKSGFKTRKRGFNVIQPPNMRTKTQNKMSMPSLQTNLKYIQRIDQTHRCCRCWLSSNTATTCDKKTGTVRMFTKIPKNLQLLNTNWHHDSQRRRPRSQHRWVPPRQTTPLKSDNLPPPRS